MKDKLSYYVVPGLPTVKATDRKSIVDFVANELNINPHKLKRSIAYHINDYNTYWAKYFISRKTKKPIAPYAIPLITPPKGSYWCDAVKLTKEIE